MNRFYLKLVKDFGEKNAPILYKLLENKQIDDYQEKTNNLKINGKQDYYF